MFELFYRSFCNTLENRPESTKRQDQKKTITIYPIFNFDIKISLVGKVFYNIPDDENNNTDNNNNTTENTTYNYNNNGAPRYIDANTILKEKMIMHYLIIVFQSLHIMKMVV